MIEQTGADPTFVICWLLHSHRNVRQREIVP